MAYTPGQTACHPICHPSVIVHPYIKTIGSMDLTVLQSLYFGAEPLSLPAINRKETMDEIKKDFLGFCPMAGIGKPPKEWPCCVGTCCAWFDDGEGGCALMALITAVYYR